MSDGGKGDSRRPTDENKFRSNYDQIKWTREEDEEFNRLQDRLSTQRTVADSTGKKEKTS